MKTSIRFIAEYYNTETGEVLESELLRNDEIKKPITIKLGRSLGLDTI